MNISPFLKHEEPRLVFFSGAGLSKDSGINTFRDTADGSGLWENFKVQNVCNIDTFMQNYDDVHNFYNARRTQLGTVQPNAAHYFIADMQKKYGSRVLHFTANVDDLNERAGGTACHLHGSLLEVINNYTPDLTYAEVVKLGYENWTPDTKVRSKPNVVFFGESTRMEDGKKTYIYDDMTNVIYALRPHDLCIVIGSGDQVIEWSWILGEKSVADTVNVNLSKQTWDDRFQYNIYGKAIDTLPDMQVLIEKYM